MLDKPPENIRRLSIVKEIGKLENKLNNECLSDQEIEETLQNIEKLKLELNDSEPEVKQLEQIQTKEIIGQASKGISKLSKLHHFIKTAGKKKPEPPATMDEVHQLKIEYQKAKLNELIAKAKANTPRKQSKLMQILNNIHESNQARQTRTSSNSKKPKSKLESYSASDHQKDIEKIFGSNADRESNIRKYLR